MSGPVELSQPTHYQVLQLPQSCNAFNDDELRTAYRRALLLHHPDKKYPFASTTPNSIAQTPRHGYSVDQITEAYKILSSPADRVDYDRKLQKTTSMLNPGLQINHHPGVETYDLEDLLYNEQTDTWSRTCRCGDARAYTLTGFDLEKVAEYGEVYAGCKGCSLSIRVLFDAAANDE